MYILRQTAKIYNFIEDLQRIWVRTEPNVNQVEPHRRTETMYVLRPAAKIYNALIECARFTC